MSLQPTGSNAPNADALRAIGNMTSAVDASGDRVQRSNDEVINTLRKALDQSENSNKLLSERNTQLAGRVETLEKNFKELEVVRQAEKKAFEDLIKALNDRMSAITDKLTQDGKKLDQTATKLDTLNKRFDGHGHNYMMTTGGGGHQTTGTSGPHN